MDSIRTDLRSREVAYDPYDQMGGYMKRSPGLNAYIKIENPPEQGVQQVFVGGEQLEPGRHYTTAFVTEQGVAKKYGRNHRPLRAEIRGTFVRYRRNPQ